MNLTVMASWFPHCSLIILEVIFSSHWLMLVTYNTVQMQQWRNAISRFRYFLSRIQHSPPYSSTESTQASYTCLFVVRKKVVRKTLVLVKTVFCKALNALEALARRLYTSHQFYHLLLLLTPSTKTPSHTQCCQHQLSLATFLSSALHGPQPKTLFWRH